MFVVVAVNALRQIVLDQLLDLLLIEMPTVIIIKGPAGGRIWSTCSGSIQATAIYNAHIYVDISSVSLSPHQGITITVRNHSQMVTFRYETLSQNIHDGILIWRYGSG